MRQNRIALPIFALCVLAAPFLAQAQTTPVTCTVATLTGTHSLVLTGRDVLSTAALSKVSLSVGTATFDGAGNVTFNLTTNTNQSTGVAQVLSGTYTLPSTCLGTLSITAGDTASFTLIPYNQGKDFTITGGDVTYGFTGSGAEQPAACLTSTLSGQYVFSGNGWSLASGAITGVSNISGLLQFDGAGAITGSWSVIANGTATPDTITGHYSVSSCVASATVTDPHGVASTLAFTLTSTDGANFSVLGASPGSLFSATGHSTFTNPGLAVELAAGSSLTTPPGSLFSIYGTGLSTGTNQATSFPLPTMLASASVTVNGEMVPLYSVNNTALGTEGIINAQMPLDIQPGVATLVVKNGTTTMSNSVAITIPATAVPGVFVNGNNHAAARNFPDYSVNSASAPAGVGSLVVIYFTGGGPVQNPSSLGTGQATPDSLFPIAETYSATIGGVSAPVGYIGLVPTTVGGFYQANITIPMVAAGEHNLIITIGGTASNMTVISTK